GVIWPRCSPERGHDNAYDNSHYCADSGADRRHADLGLQPRLGLWPWWRIGLDPDHRDRVGADRPHLIETDEEGGRTDRRRSVLRRSSSALADQCEPLVLGEHGNAGFLGLAELRANAGIGTGHYIVGVLRDRARNFGAEAHGHG